MATLRDIRQARQKEQIDEQEIETTAEDIETQEETIDESATIAALIHDQLSDIDTILASQEATDEDLERTASAIENLDKAVDMFEELSKPYSCGVVLRRIAECVNTGQPVDIEFADGDGVEITEEVAQIIANAHDQLNEKNQQKMLVMLSDSYESFEAVYQFCEKYQK